MLNILQVGLQLYMIQEFPDDQAGFRKKPEEPGQPPLGHQKRKRKTPTSALLTTPKPLTVGITTNCEKIFNKGIADHLTCILRNLYAGQKATVRTRHGTTDRFQIGKGKKKKKIGKRVRQGCILSPCLFNLNAEYIMRNTGLDEA